jgi:hypothetical protein
MKSKLTGLLLLGLTLSLALPPISRAQDSNGADKAGGDKAQTSSETRQVGPYTVNSSIEIGVRGIVIDGNADKYRSDLNYTPGFRLFDTSLLMKANNNDGFLFDTLMASSFGWGGDPNKYLRINAEKTKWYRFDSTYRRIDYFNNLTNHALQQHTSNTEYRQGDFDLTLLPQNERIKFNLGYSLSRNSGPGVTTYDYSAPTKRGDEFPILASTRAETNEYRVGVDAHVWLFDLSFQQGWRFFKDDATYSIDVPQPGNTTTNKNVLNTFHRELPTRGSTPFTRFSLHSMLAKKVDFTGRFIYTSGKTDYTLFENVTGKDSSGNTINLDSITINGNAKRPNALGDLGVTVFATDKLRISDTFRINSFRINGGQELMEALFSTGINAGGPVILPPAFFNNVSLRTTKYRRAVNTFEVDYDFHPRFSAHFGHRYSDRRIELASFDPETAEPFPGELEGETFDNRTNAYIFGFRAKPLKLWSVYFDMEKGEADNVFTRVDNYDYTNFRVRSIFRPTHTLSVNASLVTRDNTNPAMTEDIPPRQFGADINTRIFSSSVDWIPSGRYSFGGGYTYTHLTSEAAIIFFTPSNIKNEGVSRYFVRDHFFFLSTYIEFHPRAKFYGAFRIHHDSGQGDRLPEPTVFISSYPQQFASPEMKLSVKLHRAVDWVVGYQYFDFKEEFPNIQHYHAHLPYTSLRFYLGRPNGQ